MLFTTIFSTFLLSLNAALVNASPVPEGFSSRDVVDPPITSPAASTVWTVGTTQTVTWSLDGLPPVSEWTSTEGMLVLGYNANDSENLDLDNPLAQNFNLTVGSVQITVPNVSARTDYIVVLFGDSGNASPEFTIQSAPSFASNTSTTGGTHNQASLTIPTGLSTSTSITTTASTSTSVSVTVSTPSSTPTAPVSTSGAPITSSFLSSASGSSSASASSASASTNAAIATAHLNSSSILMIVLAAVTLLSV